MDIWFVDAAGAHRHGPPDLEDLLARGDGFTWIDVPTFDDDAEGVLRRLGCHEMVVEACRRRNYVPTVHGYGDHVFVTTQSPFRGPAGHVHLLELDQLVADRHLVTVHGPINPDVELEHALVETQGVLARIQGGRLRPTSPLEVCYAVTSAVARRQSAMVREVAARLPGLERQVLDQQLRDPESLLETMFLVRHELTTTRTMAAQCHDIWERLGEIRPDLDPRQAGQVRDLADQFARVRSLADGESQFLSGVIELYQTKVHTKMTVAMERLAVIAAVTLPITALASIYGMNLIVNDETRFLLLAGVLAVMAGISFLLLRWARRQGWW
ncbi:CorA family divalent cation transporter [Nocardioides sp. GCM10027113]|uniref:CorA family divalent cation transporter n=1 Tax=unclassified Nocardioides TaxID=2615069 RepID=UPI003606EFCC